MGVIEDAADKADLLAKITTANSTGTMAGAVGVSPANLKNAEVVNGDSFYSVANESKMYGGHKLEIILGDEVQVNIGARNSVMVGNDANVYLANQMEIGASLKEQITANRTYVVAYERGNAITRNENVMQDIETRLAASETTITKHTKDIKDNHDTVTASIIKVESDQKIVNDKQATLNSDQQTLNEKLEILSSEQKIINHKTSTLITKHTSELNTFVSRISKQESMMQQVNAKITSHTADLIKINDQINLK